MRIARRHSNITAAPAADLQFHLYWNAWKNTRSTFMRERKLAGDSERGRRPDERARIEVTAIAVDGADGTSTKRVNGHKDEQPRTEPVR